MASFLHYGGIHRVLGEVNLNGCAGFWLFNTEGRQLTGIGEQNEEALIAVRTWHNFAENVDGLKETIMVFGDSITICTMVTETTNLVVKVNPDANIEILRQNVHALAELLKAPLLAMNH